MPSERTGDGDPARTLALLWDPGSAPRSGPARRLRVGAVVEAATGLADREGVGAISMRRVAGSPSGSGSRP